MIKLRKFLTFALIALAAALPAALHAQIPGLQPSMLVASAAAPKVLTFQAEVNSGSNLTTYTFSAVAIGTAAADRYVIVAAAGGEGSDAVSTVTVGGTGITSVVDQNGTTSVTAAIFIGLITTGTTADIVVTFAGAQTRAGIGVWSATGLTSGTAVHTIKGTADPFTDTITTVPGGFVVCNHFKGGSGAGGGNETTWTNVTERYDAGMAAEAGGHSGADAVTTGTSLSITVDPVAGNTFAHACASW